MNKNKTIWLALLTMILWGSLFPMVKLGFSAYSIESLADIFLFAGIRFVICGSIICIFSAIKDRNSYRPAFHSIFPILMSGVFAIILHYAFTYAGLEMTESSKTALIKQLGPLFYICFSFMFIKEDKPSIKKIIAAFGGFFGIVVLNINSCGFSIAIGDFLILCASFCTVFSNVISKKVFAKVLPLTATGISQFFGGLFLLVAGWCMGGRVNLQLNSFPWIMTYICIASIVSYCIWFEIIRKEELSNLFVIKFAEPIFACIFGAILLKEDIWKLQYLIAFVLISGSIWISNKNT